MKLDIKAQLERVGISRYELSRRTGISYPAIDTIYKGNSSSIRLNTLEVLCEELRCTPNDILIPEKKSDV